jgi:uncharacterized protein YmfQ (DUF2313 family)
MADQHVRRRGEDYGQAMLELLPHGQAWPRSLDSTLVPVVYGLGEYWGFVDGRAADLLEIESDPRATSELLTDWERAWGLPDPCLLYPPSDVITRRIALVAKMTLLGAQSRAFFIGVAAALGYVITITEYSPYMTGVSRCGDQSGVFNADDPTTNYWHLLSPEKRYYWTVHVNAVKLVKFRCNSSRTGVDRLLEIYGPEDLECILNRWKPAHTHIVFDFSPMQSLDYSKTFDTQYLAMGIP